MPNQCVITTKVPTVYSAHEITSELLSWQGFLCHPLAVPQRREEWILAGPHIALVVFFLSPYQLFPFLSRLLPWADCSNQLLSAESWLLVLVAEWEKAAAPGTSGISWDWWTENWNWCRTVATECFESQFVWIPLLVKHLFIVLTTFLWLFQALSFVTPQFCLFTDEICTQLSRTGSRSAPGR